MNRFAVHVELLLDEQWTDITDRVYQRAPIGVRRGRSDESARVDPGSCSLTLDNRAGDFSPRNPTGAWYGQLGRNTPLRVWAGTSLTGGGSFAADSDTSHVAPSVFSRGDTGLLLCTWISGFESGAYAVPGSMTAGPQTDLTYSSMVTAVEPVAVPGETGTRTATFTGTVHGHAHMSIAVPGLDGPPVVEELLSDAATSLEVTLQTSSAVQAGWWLLAVQAFEFDPRDELPAHPTGTPGPWIPVADTRQAVDTGPRVRVWARPVLVDGIQEVTFGMPQGSPYILDNHARVYVLSGVVDSSVRCAVEVAAWPPRWDISGVDAYVSVEAAGVLRRLGQGAKALRSAIYRASISQRRPPLAYWPCEDGENSTSIASGLDGGPAMTIQGDSIELASFDGFVASESLPVIKQSRLLGSVRGYEPASETQIRWLMSIPAAGGVTDLAQIITIYTTSGLRWAVRYRTGGNIDVRCFALSDGDYVTVFDSGSVVMGLDGKNVRAAWEFTQNGGNIDWALATIEPGMAGGPRPSGTVTGRQMGAISRIIMAVNQNLGDVAVGHISVHDDITSIFDLGKAITAYDGETAGRRIERLCAEEGIPLRVVGDLDETEQMGPQRVDSLIELLGEAQDADGGALHETREDIGLTYRTRRSLYQQTAGLSS